MMKTKPELSFVVLTWNRAPMLELSLTSVFENISGKHPYELIILDNASTDSTGQILDRYEGHECVRIIHSKINYHLNGYKKLFAMATGRFIVELDDDVIRLPKDFDDTFIEYFKAFPDYGYVGLNVVQDEMTWGAKPGPECYKDDVRGDKVMEEGPVGGWCTAFRRWHYKLFAPFLHFFNFTMARGEDGTLMGFLHVILRRRQGLIKNAVCLHATGIPYAKKYGLLERDIEKYMVGDQPDVAERYRKAKDS